MYNRNPNVFLDFKIGVHSAGRVIIELFSDVTPKTAENFRGLCSGEYGEAGNYRLCYAGTKVLKIIDNSLIHCGDITTQNGLGGHSIYGKTFEDENFIRRHSCAGLVTMVSRGRNTINSQFYITLRATPQLDNKSVVFGQVIKGMEVVRKISKVQLDIKDVPRIPITIIDCGECGDIKTFLKYDPFKKQVFDYLSNKKRELVEGRKQVRQMLNNGVMPDQINSLDQQEQEEEQQSQIQPAFAKKRLVEDDSGPDGLQKLMDILPDELQKRVLQVSMMRSQSQLLNQQQVINEQLISKKQQKSLSRQKQREYLEKLGVQGKNYMNIPSLKIKKQIQTKPLNKQTCSVFNNDALYRAYLKRTAKLKTDMQAYQKLKNDPHYEPSKQEFRQQKVIEDLNNQAQQRKKFTRQRFFNQDQEVDYINKRNEHFNKKLKRHFGKYVAGIKASLEIVNQKN